MTFKQNYFNELPNDIQEKISIIVNKSRFNNCLKDIDNPKIRLFHKFNKMITDASFGFSYIVYDFDKLGWFWENHKNPFDENCNGLSEIEEKRLNNTYELFERYKRLSYKEYTKVSPKYANIRYYRFKYHNNNGFNNKYLTFLNKFVKKNYLINKPLKNTHLFIRKLTFAKNYIHVYLCNDYYEDNTAVDIAYNLFWAYEIIIDCLRTINNLVDISVDNAIEYLEETHILECFKIKNGVLTTFFNDT